MAEEKIRFGEEFGTEEYGLIADGDYEVKIDSIEKCNSKDGSKKFLKFTFSIRNDVEQDFKNRKLWFNVFKKDGDICYDFPKINKLILTQKGTKEYTTDFDNDFDLVIQYLIGKHLILTVETFFNDGLSQPKDDNRIVKDSFRPSDWDLKGIAPIKKSVVVDPNQKDDDCPF